MSLSVKQVSTALVVLALAAAPVAAQGPDKNASHQITQAELVPIGRKVRSLRTAPASLNLKVGEKMNLNTLKVTAYDSAGRALGLLTGYDFSIKPGEPASVYPGTITGVRAGMTELVVRYPRLGWAGRTDPRPEARVTVVVTR